jgi:hypothetical protein
MIRIARTFDARPGKRAEMLEILHEIRRFAETQGVTIQIFTEPFGPHHRVHINTDHEDAGAAQAFLDGLWKIERAREARDRLMATAQGGEYWQVTFMQLQEA